MPGSLDEKFGFATPEDVRFGFTAPPAEDVSDKFGFSQQPTQYAQEAGPQRDIPLTEHVANFVADQFDPINLAMLAASFGGWSLGGKLAAKAGFSALKSVGATELGSELLAPSMLGRVIHRAASGLGGAIPFAMSDLIKTPKPGETRAGNFGRELLALEAIDLALAIPAGGLINKFVRDYGREATAATLEAAQKMALSKGMNATDAKAAAFASVIGAKLKQAEAAFGPDAARSILASAQKLATTPADKLSEAITEQANALRSDPRVMEAMARQGVPPEALADVLGKMEGDRRVLADAAHKKAMTDYADSMDPFAEMNRQANEAMIENRIKQNQAAWAKDAEYQAFVAERGKQAANEEWAQRMEAVFPQAERATAGAPQYSAREVATGPALKISGVDAAEVDAAVQEFLKADGDISLMPPYARVTMVRINRVPELANRFSVRLREMIGQTLPAQSDVHPLVREALDSEAQRLGTVTPTRPDKLGIPLAPADSGMRSLVDSFARDAGVAAATAKPAERAAPLFAPSSATSPEAPTAYVMGHPDNNSTFIVTDPQEATRWLMQGAQVLHSETGENVTEAALKAQQAYFEKSAKTLDDLTRISLADDLAEANAEAARMRKLGLPGAPASPLDAQTLGEAASEPAIDDLISGSQRGIPSDVEPTVTRSLDGQVHVVAPAPALADALPDAERARLAAEFDAAEKQMRMRPQPRGPCKAGDFD